MGSMASLILLNGKHTLCFDRDCSNVEEREREKERNLCLSENAYHVSTLFEAFLKQKQEKKNTKLFCGNQLSRFLCKHKVPLTPEAQYFF